MNPLDKSWLHSRLAQLEAAPETSIPKVKREITSATERLYDVEETLWKKFSSSLELQEITPSLPVLKLYIEWIATTHCGRLDERPSVTTLVWRVSRFAFMYEDRYKVAITKEMRNSIVHFVENDLKERLGLSVKKFEKYVATAHDVAEIQEFLWCHDIHVYKNERIRVQNTFHACSIRDTAARTGAITRSECYRDGNDALRYEDVELWAIRKEGGGTKFRLDITFHRMKGARLDDSKFVKVSIPEDPSPKELGSSTILAFLVLAWQDNAFENINSLSHLFHIDESLPTHRNAIRLSFKASVLDKPILRRMESRGSYRISETLAWSSGSALQQFKRICEAGGWPQRVTTYNIRRGVLNELDQSQEVSDAQRNQLAGHGNSAVFSKAYLSQHTNVSIANIVQGRASRTAGDNSTGMSMARDRMVPQMDESVWADIVRNDTELQDVERHRIQVRQRQKAAHPDKLPALKSELHTLNRKFWQRTQNLRREARLEHKKKWHENRESEILKGLNTTEMQQTSTNPCFTGTRRAVIEALYPSDTSQLSMESAVGVVVKHVLDSGRTTERISRKRVSMTISDANFEFIPCKRQATGAKEEPSF